MRQPIIPVTVVYGLYAKFVILIRWKHRVIDKRLIIYENSILFQILYEAFKRSPWKAVS